jgi:hypothetical protein
MIFVVNNVVASPIAIRVPSLFLSSFGKKKVFCCQNGVYHSFLYCHFAIGSFLAGIWRLALCYK